MTPEQQAEADALKVAQHLYDDGWPDTYTVKAELVKVLLPLYRQIEELKRDKERLDWLEKNAYEISMTAHYTGQEKITRSSLDAAIANEKTESEKGQ